MMNGSGLSTQPLNSVLRPALVAGGVLLLFGIPIALAQLTTCHCRAEAVQVAGTQVITLEADDDPDCYYETSFRDGTATVVTNRRSVLMHTYDWLDGCTWESREVLTPHGPGLYAYEYTEHVVSCQPNAEPARACERHGVATVVDADHPAVADEPAESEVEHADSSEE
jgi:hypothetical protein